MRYFLIAVLALFAFSNNAEARICRWNGYYHVCSKIYESRAITNKQYMSNRHKHQRRSLRSIRVRKRYKSVSGLASYYRSGNRTATGERFNPFAKTAASRYLPFNSLALVINRYNGRSVVVRINDRGPFVGNRIIDVSLGAARELAMIDSGVVEVTVERIN